MISFSRLQPLAGLARHARPVAWAGAGLALILLCWRVIIPATQYNDYAFAAYYTASRLTLQGEAGPGFCEPWFSEQQRAFGLRPDIFCPSPPTMALLMLPVAWLPTMAARAAWVVISVGLVVAIWFVARRIVLAYLQNLDQPPEGNLRADMLAIPLAIIFIALYNPFHSELRFGQVYTLLGFGYALWFFGYLAGKDWLCSIAMAALALTKLSGWPLWLFLLLRGRQRILVQATGLTLAGAVITLPLFGLDFWQLYVFQQMATVAPDPTNAVTAYQTITGLLRQLFVYDARWSPAPLLDAPWLAAALWWLATIALLGITLRHDSRQTTLLTLMALYCVIIPLQPAGEQHHYVILLAVWFVIIMMRQTLPTTSIPALWCMGCALVLFALPPYFVSAPQLQGWPAALLAYPRLYGALLLWAGLIIARERTLRASSNARQ